MSCPHFYSCVLHKNYSLILLCCFFYFIISSRDSHTSYKKKTVNSTTFYKNKNSDRVRHIKMSGFGFDNQNSAGHFTRRWPTNQVLAVALRFRVPTHSHHVLSQSGPYKPIRELGYFRCRRLSFSTSFLDSDRTVATVTRRKKCIKSIQNIVNWSNATKVLKWLCVYFIKVLSMISPEVFLMNNKCIH